MRSANRDSEENAKDAITEEKKMIMITESVLLRRLDHRYYYEQRKLWFNKEMESLKTVALIY